MLIDRLTFFSKRWKMITAVTRWTGTPAGLALVEAGSRAAKSEHMSWGANNCRFMRPIAGQGGMGIGFYICEFDSMSAFGAFQDSVLASDWFKQMQKDVAAGHPEITMDGTTVMYDAIAD